MSRFGRTTASSSSSTTTYASSLSSRHLSVSSSQRTPTLPSFMRDTATSLARAASPLDSSSSSSASSAAARAPSRSSSRSSTCSLPMLRGPRPERAPTGPWPAFRLSARVPTPIPEEWDSCHSACPRACAVHEACSEHTSAIPSPVRESIPAIPSPVREPTPEPPKVLHRRTKIRITRNCMCPLPCTVHPEPQQPTCATPLPPSELSKVLLPTVPPARYVGSKIIITRHRAPAAELQPATPAPPRTQEPKLGYWSPETQIARANILNPIKDVTEAELATWPKQLRDFHCRQVIARRMWEDDIRKANRWLPIPAAAPPAGSDSPSGLLSPRALPKKLVAFSKARRTPFPLERTDLVDPAKPAPRAIAGDFYRDDFSHVDSNESTIDWAFLGDNGDGEFFQKEDVSVDGWPLLKRPRVCSDGLWLDIKAFARQVAGSAASTLSRLWKRSWSSATSAFSSASSVFSG